MEFRKNGKIFSFKKKLVRNNYLQNILRPTLKKILVSVVRSAKPNLSKAHGRWELFGMDTILDEDLNVWLTEIQFSPGLSLDHSIKVKLMPEIVKATTEIVLEINEKKFRHAVIDSTSNPLPGLNGTRMQWVINEALDPPFVFGEN